ncbi:LacI family DNA-binding transcriptional regulator [Cytobacillus purgationiresistens]|uniref:DNA-binding LacI/PurR family transcriptional regulator n=1 Tax=Cytobacillus purgationiresistens TaxID=863449 RepID=A0ABU0AM81_9BACI|nr:LacI family DNA-binding transcriptional regulator [Cytobacillus purgationiresistens]MDQ0272369.1 DNA-binding LacI/PurR family transcriptional regulator [Cytobacillus purgationiresistens]
MAKLARVDPSVVSRIINDDTALLIKDETRKRVLEAIKELNYRPNANARSLRKRKTMMLGMVIPDFLNPVYGEIIRGAELQASTEGYHLMVCSINKDSKCNYLSLLREGRIDGLMVASSEFEDSSISELEKENMPFILVNRLTLSMHDYVIADDTYGAKLAVNHLIDLGHTQIGHLSGPLFTGTGTERFQGYRAALKESGIDFFPSYLHETGYTVESGYEGMMKLLELPDPPTAVFAANVLSSIGAIQAIKVKGLTVPDDISVVGVHDVFFASMIDPALTTVKMPLFEMGIEAVKSLIKKLNGEQTGVSVRIPGAELIVRKSTSVPPTKSIGGYYERTGKASK